MASLVVSASPQITKKGHTTRRIMIDVLIALSPVLIAAILFFGVQVLINAIVCMAACFGTELLYDCIKNKKFSKEVAKKSTAWDFSSLVTGLILALNLPSKMIVKGWDFNIYKNARINSTITGITLSIDVLLVGIIGSIFAIMLVKMLFGGIGRNFMNPAAAARAFLFIAFGLFAVQTIGSIGEISTGATWLSSDKITGKETPIMEYFIGNRGAAAVGETCIIAILLGYAYLVIRKVIDFRLPLIIIASTAFFALIFKGLGEKTTARTLNYVIMNVLSGGLVFGAVFMATDYSSSPNSFWGKVIFGVGIGLFTMVIRVFAGYPEGMSFAILIMNTATPIIDKYIFPRPFGFVPNKKEKKVKAEATSEKSNSEVKA